MTDNNYLRKQDKLAAKHTAKREYNNLRMRFETVGYWLFVAGFIGWVLERVWLINDVQRVTLTWLAYFYNPIMMVGAGLIGGCAFHHVAKRNGEIERLAAIEDELHEIHVQRLDFIGGRNEKVVEIPSVLNKTAS